MGIILCILKTSFWRVVRSAVREGYFLYSRPRSKICLVGDLHFYKKDDSAKLHVSEKSDWKLNVSRLGIKRSDWFLSRITADFFRTTYIYFWCITRYSLKGEIANDYLEIEEWIAQPQRGSAHCISIVHETVQTC